MGAVGLSSARELKCAVELGPSIEVLIHLPEAVDQAGLNYTLPFTGVC